MLASFQEVLQAGEQVVRVALRAGHGHRVGTPERSPRRKPGSLSVRCYEPGWLWPVGWLLTNLPIERGRSARPRPECC